MIFTRLDIYVTQLSHKEIAYKSLKEQDQQAINKPLLLRKLNQKVKKAGSLTPPGPLRDAKKKVSD
jgi:hypothetical protein